MYKLLDIGCGRYKLKDAIGIDQDSELATLYPQGEFVCVNLNREKLPFDDNSIDEIYASHIIEHFKNPRETILKEIHRVLKKGGLLRSYFPNETTLGETNSDDPDDFGHKVLMSQTWFEDNVSDMFTVAKKETGLEKNLEISQTGKRIDMHWTYVEAIKQ